MQLAGLLLGLVFNPEDRGDTFLRNVGWFSTDNAAMYPRGQNSSQPPLWEPEILHVV
jgi:hypothetical protein